MGKIKVTQCGDIEGLKVIEPTVFGDSRGYFMETYNYNDFKEAGIDVTRINKLSEGGRPNTLDAITNGQIDLIVNSPVGKDSVNDDSYLRKAAIKAKIPYMTTIAAARATAKGIRYVKEHGNGEVKSLQQLHSEITDK